MFLSANLPHAHSVTTSSQKVLEKLARKDKRRAERAGADADLEWLLVRLYKHEIVLVPAI